MKWLITGGAGFIGANAAARFLKMGHSVVILDNLQRQYAQKNLDWLRSLGLRDFFRTDLRDFSAVQEVGKRHSDIDVILHLASQVAVTTSLKDPRQDFEINALGTINILETARTVLCGRPAVFLSSTNKVYGDLGNLTLTSSPLRVDLKDLPLGISEDHPLDFHSPYGCSKGAADQYVRDYARVYGLQTVVFRQSCIYGDHQNGTEDQGWISWMFQAVRQGQPIVLYGDGRQVRDALWIDDLIDLYLAASLRLEKVSGHIFNIGGGAQNSLSLLELIHWIEGTQGRCVNRLHSVARVADQRCFIADIRKAKALLDWEPTVFLPEGLSRLWNWLDPAAKRSRVSSSVTKEIRL